MSFLFLNEGNESFENRYLPFQTACVHAWYLFSIFTAIIYIYTTNLMMLFLYFILRSSNLQINHTFNNLKVN